MEYLIGVILAVAVIGLAAMVGFDRERAFYPTVLIVVGAYYVLFAAMAASQRTLVFEILVASGFLLFAIIGYKRSFWVVAFGLAGHGLFDLVHRFLFENPGVPRWWPGFCMACDVTLGGWVALRLLERKKS